MFRNGSSASPYHSFPVVLSRLPAVFVAIAIVVFLSLVCHSSVFALTGPSVSFSAPTTARGYIEVTVNYSFPEDSGRLVLEVSAMQVRPLDTFIAGGNGSIVVTLNTAYWSDGTHTIKAGAAYTNSPLFASDGPRQIVSDNTPVIAVASPQGEARGLTQFNLSYDFPAVGGMGLFWFYIDDNPVDFTRKQVTLPTVPPATGNLVFTYDASYWGDGPHTIKIVARTGGCFNCDWAPNPSIQTISVNVDNSPHVNTIKPAGNVRGTVNASIEYDFFPMYARPATVALEYKTPSGTYTTIATRTLMLNPDAPTAGVWDFTFDVSAWQDGSYELRARATCDTRVSYDLESIRVVNSGTLTYEPESGKPTYVGEPINVANGVMHTSYTDILIPAREIPLELTRNYNSHDASSGPFGYGWRLNVAIGLTEQSDQSILELDDKWVHTIYTPNPDGTYRPSAGKYSELTKNPDGTYCIVRKHGRKLFYDSNRRLMRIEGRNGDAIVITRHSNNFVAGLEDSSGRKISLILGPQGRISEVRDPSDRVFKYDYDDAGNLIKVTDPLNNVTTYEYDAQHNLTCITDPNGHALHFTYDASDRAYHSWQDGGNNELTLSHDPDNFTTVVTDSRGAATTYEYNDYGLVTKITDSSGAIGHFSWDEQLNRTSITDARGNTTEFTYDAGGNLLAVKDPLNNIASFSYETGFDFVSSMTDALGGTILYSYDPRGNLIGVTDALNNATANVYDDSGRLTQSQDANGNVSGFGYDSYGNLCRITDPLGNQTLFSFDILGNVTERIDARGNATHFTYDALNRLIETVYADGTVTLTAYDPAGNKVSSTDQNGLATTFAYDVVNRLTGVTDAAGNVTQYAHDTEGNRLSIIDPNGSETKYTYDTLNRLIATTDPLQNLTVSSYDPNGNIISKTDANGTTVTYTYDANNRLISTTYPDASTVSFGYDEAGRRTSMTDASGTTTYAYDALGRLTEVNGPKSNDTISYVYDKVGNRVQMTDPNNGITTYSYDALNRLISMSNPQGEATTYSYDTAGNLIRMDYPNNTQATYDFNAVNRLTSLSNRTGTVSLSSYNYDYDPAGMRTKATLADGSSIQYTYDEFYRLTKEERYNPAHELLYTIGYTFDLAGNRLTQHIDSATDDFKISGFPLKSSLAYTYNQGNQLTRLKVYRINRFGESVLKKTHDYTYDPNGNLTRESVTDDSGQLKRTRTHTYDYENRLTRLAIVAPGVSTTTIDYTYDGSGKRLSEAITRTGGVDEEDEEGGEEEEDVRFRSFLYDGMNVIIERDATEDTLTTYTRGLNYPGGIGGIISRTNQNNNSFYYHYDGLGSVTQLTNRSALITTDYTYDAYGNLLSQEGLNHGNRYHFSTKHHRGGLYYFGARYYDPRIGRFLTADPLGMIDGPNRYLYVNNNPVNFIDPWGWCKQMSWWEWWLLEMPLPGWYFGQPVSEWGPEGPTGGFSPMEYTEEAGGAWMWAERGAIVTSAAAALTAGGLMVHEAITGIRIEFHFSHLKGPHKYPHFQTIKGPGWGKTLGRWPSSWPW